MFIQMEGFVVIEASFTGAALNHYTCTNLLIYLRAVGVAVHIILRFYGLAEHVPVGIDIKKGIIILNMSN